MKSVSKNFTFVIAILFFLLLSACQQPVGGGDNNNNNGGSSGIKTAVPTFSISPGTYTTPQKLELSCSTSSAGIYYSIDGGAEEVYSAPISLPGYGKSYQISAYAKAGGMEKSDSTSGIFNITGTLTIDYKVDNSGDVATGKDYPKIRIFCTDPSGDPVTGEGTYIRYTENGEAPQLKGDGFHYTGVPFSFNVSTDYIYLLDSLVIRAIGYKKGWKTSTVELLKHPLQLKEPIFVPGGLEPITDKTLITIVPPVSGAKVFYKMVDYDKTLTDRTDDITIPYTTPFNITRPKRIKAIVKKANWKTSKMERADYKLILPEVKFTPPPVDGAVYTEYLQVTMSCPGANHIPGLRIKYTINGEDPLTSASAQSYNPQTSKGLSISKSTTIKAYAYIDGDEEGNSNGWYRSNIATASYSYEIECPFTATEEGIYNSEQSVVLDTVTPGVDIYYLITTDPSADLTKATGEKYTTAFTLAPPAPGDTSTDIGGRIYLKAKAYRRDSSTDSSIEMLKSYTFKLRPPELPSKSTAYSAFKITMTHNVPGVTIKYTTDMGVAPGIDIKSGDTIDIYQTMSVKAIAVKENWADSDAVKKDYTLTPSTPIFIDPLGNEDGGHVYREEIKLKGHARNDGATVYFTLNGGDPTKVKPPELKFFVNNDIIDITKTTTLTAVSYLPNWGYSDPVTLKYELKVKEPVIELAAGDYDGAPVCTLRSMTKDAKIYFTKDGKDPALKNTTPFTDLFDTLITKNTTLRLIAMKDGWTNSDEVSSEYLIKLPAPVCILTKNKPSAPKQVFFDTSTDNTTDIVRNTYIYELDDIPLGTLILDNSRDGVNMKYTTDGVTDPSETVGTRFATGSTPINILKNGTIVKSIAYYDTKLDFINSNINVTKYIFKAKQPTFRGVESTAATKLYSGGRYIDMASMPGDNKYKINAGTITLTSSTVNSVINYTVDYLNGFSESKKSNSGAEVSVYSHLSAFKITMDASRDDWELSEPNSGIFYRQLDAPIIANGDPIDDLSPDARIVMSYPDIEYPGGYKVDPTGIMFYYTSAAGTTPPADPDPTGGAILYKEEVPINVTETTTFKAVAVKDGWLVSQPATFTIHKCKIDSPANNATETFPYSRSGTEVTVNASGAPGKALEYWYANDYGIMKKQTQTFKVTNNYKHRIVVKTPGDIPSTEHIVDYEVQLLSPTFKSIDSPIAINSKVECILPTETPDGSKIFYSLDGVNPVKAVSSDLSGKIMITISKSIWIRTQCNGYKPSEWVKVY